MSLSLAKPADEDLLVELMQAALQRVEEVCRMEGIRALHLEVDRGNTRAQELYRRVGYRDHDRYLLTKWLEG